MDGRFPHLTGANGFPGTGTVAPFEQYQNTFDYSRWTPDVRITLYNVPWDGDYRNVVKFPDDAAREAWFAKQPGRDVRLTETVARRPGEALKLPLPFDEIVRYNYIVVDFGYATSAGQPIDYETSEGFRKHFYFMDDYTYLAPSTTMVNVTDDDWTTFIDHADIPMLMLERGHYPVANSDVDAYLADPMANCSYLTGPDVDYGGGTVVRSQSVVPLEQGERYVCFSVPYSLTQLTAAKEGTAASGGTAPTYTDIADATGHQARMNVDYGFYPRDYSAAGPVPIEPATAVSDMTVGNNLTTLAVKASSVYGPPHFFQAFADRYPHYFREIQACFIVGSDIVRLSNPKTFCGVQVHEVAAAHDIEVPVALTRSMFDIPAPYANLAKLYTSPYSTIEFIDADGGTTEFRPENCSSLKVVREVCIAYPWVNVTAFLAGAGGSGKSQITVHKLDGTTESGTLWADDFARTMYRYDIPTYTLRFSGYTEASVSGSVDLDIRERDTQTRYTNAARSANQSYNASILSNATAYDNAVASANTAKANADASADTAKANTDANADTAVANTARNNALRSAVTELGNAANLNVFDSSIAANTYANTEQLNLNDDVVTMDNNMARALTSNQNKSDSAVQQNNAKATMGRSIMEPLIAGISQGGPEGLISGAVGAISGALNATITNETNAANTNVAISTRTDAMDTTNTNNVNKLLRNNEASGNIFARNTGLQRDVTGIRNDTATANANATNSTNTAVTGANSATSKANATRSQTTSKNNASRSQGTSIGNASDTKQTSDTNALNGRDTTIGNAQRSATTDWLNARDSVRKDGMAPSRAIGSTSGDPTSYTDGRCAVRVAVRTQGDGAMTQTGAYFARYGYAWAGMVRLDSTDDLIQMRNFTYWKASEVWVTGDKLIESARDTIERVLLAGTTVWRNPDEIGEVPVNAQL